MSITQLGRNIQAFDITNDIKKDMDDDEVWQ
jgi:hypothetical protein